jgi:hypothetical protein
MSAKVENRKISTGIISIKRRKTNEYPKPL